jgi:hypothetical protein
MRVSETTPASVRGHKLAQLARIHALASAWQIASDRVAPELAGR